MIWQDGDPRDWPSVETREDEARRHGEVACPMCGGSGFVFDHIFDGTEEGHLEQSLCPQCEGHGYIPAREAHDCDDTPGCPRCYKRTGDTVCGQCCPHAEEA